MTFERAKYILSKKIDFIKENWENENTFDYFWTKEDVEAIEIIFIALENDKNAFIKQVEITQEANSLYEQEKEKNKKLEEVIDMMAEKLVRVPENDFMSETQLSVVRFINLHIEEKKEHIKKYYFSKVKEKQDDK